MRILCVALLLTAVGCSHKSLKPVEAKLTCYSGGKPMGAYTGKPEMFKVRRHDAKIYNADGEVALHSNLHCTLENYFKEDILAQAAQTRAEMKKLKKEKKELKRDQRKLKDEKKELEHLKKSKPGKMTGD